MKTPRISIHLPILLSCVLLSAPGESRGAEQPADPYANVMVLAQEEEGEQGGETTRTTLAQDDDLKYPVLRIVENVFDGDVIEQSATVGDHIIVELKAGKTQADLEALNAQLGGTIRRKLPLSSVYLVAFTNAALDTVPNAIAAYGQANDVLYADADSLASLESTTPNDPAYTNLWGLHNTGQTGGTADYDIDAPEAWDTCRGTGVVVAVFDSGIDYNHEDLAANMWVNSVENPTNGVDDDGNGYVDDVYGIDAYNNDSDPMDDNNHGTHCAGTIAATGNNSTGVIGVAWQAKVMALKCWNAAGDDSPVSDRIECADYVISMASNGVNIRVTNHSYSSSSANSSMRSRIQTMGSLGILVVAAAGNRGQDSADYGSTLYPCSYDEENVIAVAAMDHNGNMPSWSSHGVTRADLSAPGKTIRSTLRNNGYGNKDGTSMAAPHVVGVAALVFSHAPSTTITRARQVLLEGAAPLPAPTGGRTATDGCVNASNSLALLDAVIKPTFDPPEGFYDTNAVTVTIECETAGATIYYTTNGVAPDETSAVYTNPVTVSLGTTLKARAYLAGLSASPVHSGEYEWPRLRTAYWSMDAYPGWTEEGLWEFGVPLGGGSSWSRDPGAAATGSFVYGYNLAGDYDKGVTRTLTTQAFNCSDLVHTQLRFRRCLGLRRANASIQVSNDGTNWSDVWWISWVSVWSGPLPYLYSGVRDKGNWKTRTYDISEIADGQPTVYLRWVMGPTDGSASGAGGWNIDDVEILGSTPPAAARWAF